MCGIAAIFGYGSDAPPVDSDELIAIRDRMFSRGPDGEGIWISDDRRVGLAHRRLTIVDLTDAGLQPMWNRTRNLCVTFNGEIYNYPELRRALEGRGCRLASNCDTEVLLHLYAEKGPNMVHELRGMYAFAIWDTRERTLFCARDPFGIKPLYYADDGKSVRIASQVKALLAGGRIDTASDPAGHVGFFLWGSVPEPFTFYRGVSALPAGHTLTIRAGAPPVKNSFCFIPDILRDAECATRATPLPPGGQSETLHEALRDSAEHHLMADVPVGIFLSAGLDSSTLTALVSERHRDVRTVTLGFNEFRESEQDETRLAEVVASHYQTHHQTIWITRPDFEAAAPSLLEAMDLPTIDGVNSYFISLATKRAGLKVALSGLGGDELFGGYPSFRDVPRTVNALRPFHHFERFGRGFRWVTQRMIKHFTSPKYAGLFEYGSSYPGAYLLRRSLFMPWELPEILEPDLVREGWRRLNTFEHLGLLSDSLATDRLKVSALELCWYMRHQLLRDADWAGMAHSLEIRVPLVDLKLLRDIAPLLASTSPPGKHDMARSAAVPLPEAVMSRPKTGFSVPVRDWLLRSFDPLSSGERGLRGWAREVYSHFADPLEMHRRALRTKPRGIRRDLRAVMLLTDGFGGSGGIAKFNRNFLTALCAHARMAQVTAIPRLMPNDPGQLPEKLELVTEGLGGKRQFVAAAIRTAMNLRRLDPSGESIMLFCGHINYLRIASALQRICGGAIHLITHGIEAWKPKRGAMMNRALRRLAGFIAVSKVTKTRFQSWSGLRFDQGVILPNCVDLERFQPGPRNAALTERYGLNGRKVLMTLGRLSPEEKYKGIDEMIELMPRLAQDFPGIAYLVCGEGADRSRLVAKARELRLDVLDFSGKSPGRLEATIDQPMASRVVFTGLVAESEKADHYRLADVYVMPSSGEGFGIAFIEALACGVPAIGSKADGSREALREGRLGRLVDPRDPDDIYDAVIRTLADSAGPGPRIARGELEYFSEERFTSRLHEIIDAIAPAGGDQDSAPAPQRQFAHQGNR